MSFPVFPPSNSEMLDIHGSMGIPKMLGLFRCQATKFRLHRNTRRAASLAGRGKACHYWPREPVCQPGIDQWPVDLLQHVVTSSSTTVPTNLLLSEGVTNPGLTLPIWCVDVY